MSEERSEGTFEELYEYAEKAVGELDYRKTLNLLNKMSEICEDDLQECWTRVLFASLSLMFEGEELDLTEARELANYALALSKKKDNQRMELDVMGLISLIEDKCGIWDAFIENAEVMLLLSEELDEVDWICASHQNLCKGYSMMRLFTRAKSHLDTGSNYVQSDPLRAFSHGIANIQYLLAYGNSTSSEELIQTKEEIQKIAKNLASNDEVTFVVPDSQNIIRNLEEEMGTSLFSIISGESNADESETGASGKDGRRYKTNEGVVESSEGGALSNAVSRMDDVRARHPQVWDEASKQNRREEWTPYQMDASVRQKQKEIYEGNMHRLQHQQRKRPVQVNRPRKKDSDDSFLWLIIVAFISFMFGGAFSG